MLISTQLALPWTWRRGSNARNLVLLLQTDLLVPYQLQGRYKADKPCQLRYHYDRKLELASVRVVQGYNTVAYLPLPEAQQVHAWKVAGKRFSFRIRQDGDAPDAPLQLRITQP
jgi:hypothetical protein